LTSGTPYWSLRIRPIFSADGSVSAIFRIKSLTSFSVSFNHDGFSSFCICVCDLFAIVIVGILCF